MYQRLGNIYSDQRIGSFESEGTGFAGEGWSRRRWRSLTNEQLADRLAKKEAKLTQLRAKIASGSAGPNAARRATLLEQQATRLRNELAARKNPEALNGLGTFDLSAINPLQLGIGAVLGAGVYWFAVRPRLARAFRRKR
jgi:hypothetical protein